MKHRSQQGVALVITLIMLAVITFLAVTFLAVSRRERGSVTTATDQTTARLAADAALDRAKVELIAPMLAATNGQLFDLLVSTNYINGSGLTNNAISPYNVNYDRRTDDPVPYTEDDLLLNIGNLLFSPRPPVFVSTNRDKNFPLDFRFYLDLNRNGLYDTNGHLPVLTGDPLNPWLDANGNPVAAYDSSNILLTNYVGDPEWVGVLERPEMRHSPSNRFVSRYAFIVVPAGRTLDINSLHNQAKRLTGVGGTEDGFYRNQGVGTWEINLAAFLADLNTNLWLAPGSPYVYNTNSGFSSTGVAFEDARDILTNRYAGTFANLNSAAQIFSNNALPFIENHIDDYSDGSLMFTTTNIEEAAFALDLDDRNQPWSGADNRNHFFTTQDLLDRTKFPQVTSPSSNFVDRVIGAGRSPSSYDRYTYYRLLSQLGTDTGTGSDKINVNYVNVDDHGRIIPNLATNLVRWTNSIQFFTNAADRLLRAYTTNWLASNPTNFHHTFSISNAFSLTNIPVWVNNQFVYRPSVHRLLQLAANIYDASNGTNGTREINGQPIGYPALPSVFRPIFRLADEPLGTNGARVLNVYISGYSNVIDGNDIVRRTMRDLYDTNDLINLEPDDNIHGVPLVIGAKKGYPNFNELSYETTFNVSRRLEFRRQDVVNGDPFDEVNNKIAYTNQLYSVSVSNRFGIEAWNSYLTNYARPTRLIVTNDITLVFFKTNDAGVQFILQSNRFAPGDVLNLIPPTGVWTNFQDGDDAEAMARAYRVPLQNLIRFFTNDYAYVQGLVPPAAPLSFGVYGQTLNIEDDPFPVNQWWLRVSTRVRYILEDLTPGSTQPYIIDYVSLNIHDQDIDITRELMSDLENPANPQLDRSDGGQWVTNRQVATDLATAPIGIVNQILVGTGQLNPISEWRSYNQKFVEGDDKEKAIARFRYNLLGGSIDSIKYPGVTKSNIFDAPYVPVRVVYAAQSFQANDPLVHYTLEDLTAKLPNTNTVSATPPSPDALDNIGKQNTRYQPWGVGDAYNINNPAFKDPQMLFSDRWDFPTNALPNIGWLGRVHRGTPWQTVYLKSTDVTTNVLGSTPSDWQKWTGNGNWGDANRSLPQEDRKLFEFFTTAVNDNASRGQLSVNQPGLAAWSAVLSGVIAVTNTADTADVLLGQIPPTAPWIIEPAFGMGDSPVARIVKSINATRQNAIYKGSFQSAGDVLATPELTLESPFLNREGDQTTKGITEEMYERVPEQILSLLRLGEQRFVIYSFGQTLRPAPRSIVTSGPFFGLCTNYQVTAEVGTRTVLRVDGAPKPGDTNAAIRLSVESFNLLPPD